MRVTALSVLEVLDVSGLDGEKDVSRNSGPFTIKQPFGLPGGETGGTSNAMEFLFEWCVWLRFFTHFAHHFLAKRGHLFRGRFRSEIGS